MAKAPAQESVWDYPRPPALVAETRSVRVEFAGQVIAQSNASYRILETSHPPTFYIPAADVRWAFLTAEDGTTSCEWKGAASYWSIAVAGRVSARAAWSYATPRSTYAAIAGCVSFYASRVDACFVGDEKVQAQAGDFYGGWITSEIVGPFKGGAGTVGW